MTVLLCSWCKGLFVCVPKDDEIPLVCSEICRALLKKASNA